MKYLEQNMNNSLIFPYEIMLIINEYANPFYAIKSSIKNKNYDLDNFMYQKMKNLIQNNYFKKGYDFAIIKQNRIACIVNQNNFNDLDHKDLTIQHYKHYFLSYAKNKNNVCGFETNNGQSNTGVKHYYKYLMERDLKVVNPNELYQIKTIQELYKEWVKL